MGSDFEIEITREDIIIKLEEFLSGKINANELEDYAWNLITEEHFTWEDNTLSDVIFQLDNPTINYPINRKNVELWKHRLKTDEDLLRDYNYWDSHIEKQKEVCNNYNSKWNPINKELMIGISDDISLDPINGLRHPREGNLCGWYIWSGEWSNKSDFFKPICAKHLLEEKPNLIKYLGLDVGFRFLLGKNNYEDVWYDPKLKNI